MGGRSTVGRRVLADLPGRRGRVAGEDPCSPMAVRGRDGGQGHGLGCRVLGLAGLLDQHWLRPLGSASHRRRIHRPEAYRATFHSDAHRRVHALGRRPALPPSARRRERAIGPRNREGMVASFVEWISRGVESVPRGAACALTCHRPPPAEGSVRRHSYRHRSQSSQGPRSGLTSLASAARHDTRWWVSAKLMPAALTS